MKNPLFAAIDIGSHNCRLTIVEKVHNSPKILLNQSNGTNLIKIEHQYLAKISLNTGISIEEIRHELISELKDFYKIED